MNSFLTKFKDEYRAIDILPSLLLISSFFLGGLREFNEWTVFTVMFIGIVLLFREKISIRKAGLWAVFALWILISIFFSHAPLESFWQFAKYILFFLFFCFTASREESALKIWVFVVFSFALLSAVIVFYQAPNFNLPLPNNPNYTAAFFAACSGALVLIIVSVRCIKERFYSSALLIVFLMAMLLLRSRGAILAFIIVSMLILIYRRYYKTLVFSLFSIMATAFFIPSELILELLKIHDVNAFQRLNIWRAALEGISLYPMWGYGAGGFESLFSSLKFPAFDGLSYFGHYGRHAHSGLLNIAAGSGIAAALIFIAAFIKSLKFKIKSNIYIDIVRVFAIVVFLQSCVDVILYSGSLNLLFFGSLGFISMSTGFEKKQKVDKFKTQILIFTAMILLGVLVVKQKQNNLRDCSRNCEEVAMKIAALEKVSSCGLKDEALLLENIRTKVVVNLNYPLALAHARYAERAYPFSWTFKFLQAEIYFKTLNYSRAKDKIKDTLRLEPNCLPARIMLSEILYAEGEFKAALKEVLIIEKMLKKLKARRLIGYNKALLKFDYNRYDILKKKHGK